MEGLTRWSPRRAMSSLNASLDLYREKVWLLGDGRSGTTWVADLINARRRYRELFEPFHPKIVPEARPMEPGLYLRETDQDHPILTFAEKVFSGKLWNARVDSENRIWFFQGLLVKDIFANLLARAVCVRIPKIRPVLLIRNPFAVALSKQKKPNWFWLEDPLKLVAQKSLRTDFLHPYEEVIRRTASQQDFILNQLLIWCVFNLVPLRQFPASELHCCFYEKLYVDPGEEVSRIMRFVKQSDKLKIRIPEAVASRPSRVAGADSSLFARTSPLTNWKDGLPATTIDQGFELMETFGLADLYADDSGPRAKTLAALRHQ